MKEVISKMATNKLQKRKQSDGTYSLEFTPHSMDTVQKDGNEYIKVSDLVNGTIFKGRNIPSRIACFYNIKPFDITWKYDLGKDDTTCDGNTDYCYLVRDDNFCPKGFYLCLPHNHIVDWRYNALGRYFLSEEEFEQDHKMSMKEYGKEQAKEHTTSYEDMKDRFGLERY
jgi:hypothetical protein